MGALPGDLQTAHGFFSRFANKPIRAYNLENGGVEAEFSGGSEGIGWDVTSRAIWTAGKNGACVIGGMSVENR